MSLSRLLEFVIIILDRKKLIVNILRKLLQFKKNRKKTDTVRMKSDRIDHRYVFRTDTIIGEKKTQILRVRKTTH